MPKPFVHLFGPPLDVTLDARTGHEARFLRSGRRPNAVLRPVICPRAKGNDEHGSSASKGSDSEMLTFGVALRNIKANEEAGRCLDGHAIHHLPALIETPHLFEYAALLIRRRLRITKSDRLQGTSPQSHSKSNGLNASRS